MWIAIISFLIFTTLLFIANKISKMKKFAKGFEVSDADLETFNDWKVFSWPDTLVEAIIISALFTWIDNAFENIILSFLFYFLGYLLLSIITKGVLKFLEKKGVF